MNLTPEEAQRLLGLAEMALNTIAREAGMAKLQALVEAAKQPAPPQPEPPSKT